MTRLTNKGFTARAPQTAAAVPELPDFDAELAALPGGQETNASLQRWWDVIRQRIEFNNGDVTQRMAKISASFDNGVNTLQAQITHEEEVRADADTALGIEIDTVSATVDGLSASVTILSSALATATGYLESRWTVNVTAGPIVTGMTLFSSSGPDTDVSYIAFQADRFQINTASGGNKQIFSATASAINLGNVLTVDLANSKLFIGTGTYANANTYFYVDTTSGGRMSLGDKFVWDGSALTVIGTITISNPTSFGVNYAGAASPGAAATSIVSQGALATLNSASWATQVSSRPTELTDGRITTALSAAGLVISGVTPGINVTTGSAGLYLGADFMGYYNGAAWRTYMDNSGNFYLGGTSGALQWNGTTLTVTGVINVTSISGLNYAGSPSAGGAANSITGQGAFATLSSANYNTQLTNQPTNSSGALLVTSSPSGSGLFLGSDHLGYYASGAWKTYMDNAGNFYLGGTSGSLQWNGSTLTINGGGTFSGALSAASGTFTGTLSGATGSFSGSITSTSGTIGGFTLSSTTLSAGSGSTYIEIANNAGTGITLGSPGNNYAIYGAGNVQLYDSSGRLAIYLDSTSFIQLKNTSNVVSITISRSGSITASSFSGDGSSLTSLNANQLSSGTVDNARLPSAISVTSLAGDGSGLTALDAGAISSGTLSNSRLPGTISVTSLEANNYSANGNGVTYGGLGGANNIGFTWNGANVKVWVDGSAQGTIPNP